MRLLTILVCTILPAGLWAQIAGQPTTPAPTGTPSIAALPIGGMSNPVNPPAKVATAPATTAPCTKPQSFYAAGGSYNKAATPNLGGLFVIGVPLTCSSNSFQVYSYTEHNIVPVGSGNNLSFKDTTSSGFATPLRQFAFFDVFAFGNIGVTTATSTPTTNSNVSVNSAYGVFAAFPLYKGSAWRGIVAAQRVAANNVYSVLFGRSF